MIFILLTDAYNKSDRFTMQGVSRLETARVIIGHELEASRFAIRVNEVPGVLLAGRR